MTSKRWILHTAVVLGAVASVLLAGFAVSPTMASAAPTFSLSSLANTTVAPGGSYRDLLEVRNLGDSATDGSEIDVRLELPPGMTAVSANTGPGNLAGFSCGGGDGGSPVLGASTVTCASSAVLQTTQSGSRAVVEFVIAVDGSVTGTLVPEFEAGGGGAETVETVDPVIVTANPAAFGIEGFDTAVRDADGDPFRQAGGHPYDIRTHLTFNRRKKSDPLGDFSPAGDVRDVSVDLPEGLVGSTAGLEECNMRDLVGVSPPTDPQPLCSPLAQIGTVMLQGKFFDGQRSGPLPLFNLSPSPGVAARFGFNLVGTTVVLDAKLQQDGSYSLSMNSQNISQGLAVVGIETVFWGQPGSPAHDTERACPGQSAPWLGGSTCKGNPEVAFLRMPTACADDLPFTVSADSWENPGRVNDLGMPDLLDSAWHSARVFSHQEPGLPYPTSEWGPVSPVTGCGKVPVTGTLSATPTTIDSETATGLSFDLAVPNEGLENPASISSSDLKSVKVKLPTGLTINPSQAEGLGICSPEQYASARLSLLAGLQEGCPGNSKIGTVEVHTPLIKESIPGDVYVAEPYNNPFHSLLALYVVLHEPQRGVLVKLAGQVETDTVTGQITTTFDDLPQLPIRDFHFHFREGARAPLVTPPACGTYTTEALMTPWSDPSHPIIAKSSFEVVRGIGGAPCPLAGLPPFKPGLIAGSINNSAGAFSPFYVRLFRSDGEQEITHFSIKLPPGQAARLAGVQECSDGAIAAAKGKSGAEELTAPSCPLASEIGHTLVGAGVGSVLTYAPGKVYLAGPYHGAPISLVAITAAKVGPFDLGTVVVRDALKINPETAEVFVDATGSDPIPHIIDGITTHLRDIRIYVDRPDFALNPTSCAPTSTVSTVLGSGLDFASEADDQPVTVTTRYQAANCASLPFKPKLSLKLIGGTKRSNLPKLRAVLRARRGEANIARTQVVLPHSEFLESAHIRSVCTRIQFADDACPASSVYGHARAVTPLLDEPLSGPVYLRSNGGQRELPDLVAALHSGRIDINLVGYIDSVRKGQLRTTFAKVPDAPVSKFVLTMQGGRKGLLVNSTDLCRRAHRAEVKMVGHNGKLYAKRTLLQAKCRRGGR